MLGNDTRSPATPRIGGLGTVAANALMRPRRAGRPALAPLADLERDGSGPRGSVTDPALVIKVLIGWPLA